MPSRYAEWVLDAQTPLILLTFAAPFLLRSGSAREEPRATRTAFAWLGVAFAISIVACYLPYTVFDAWW